MREKRNLKTMSRLLTAAAAILAVLLAAACGYTAAKYVTESGASVYANVDGIHVTSSVEYEDAWTNANETAKAFNGNLGVMVADGDVITFTLTVTNESVFPVTCKVEVNDDFEFASAVSGCILSDGVITFSGQIAANGGTASATFSVKQHTSWVEGEYHSGAGVYTRDLELTVTYVQAG